MMIGTPESGGPHADAVILHSDLQAIHADSQSNHVDITALHADMISLHSDLLTLHTDLAALLPKISGKATITVSPVITTVSQLIIAANPNRIGLILYNNSANSIYLAYGSAANSSTNMTKILATFANVTMEQPIYTGAIYGIRNAGTGTVLVTELTVS